MLASTNDFARFFPLFIIFLKFACTNRNWPPVPTFLLPYCGKHSVCLKIHTHTHTHTKFILKFHTKNDTDEVAPILN